MASLLSNDEKLSGKYERGWPWLRAAWRDEAGPAVLLTDLPSRVHGVDPTDARAGARVFSLGGVRVPRREELLPAVSANRRDTDAVLTFQLRRKGLLQTGILPLLVTGGNPREEEVLALLGLAGAGLPAFRVSEVLGNYGIRSGAVIREVAGKPATDPISWRIGPETKEAIVTFSSPEQPGGASVVVDTRQAPDGVWGVTFPPAVTLATRYGWTPPVDAAALMFGALARGAGIGAMSWPAWLRTLPDLSHRWYEVGSGQWKRLDFWLTKLAVALVFLGLGLLILARTGHRIPGRLAWLATNALVTLLLLKDFYVVLTV